MNNLNPEPARPLKSREIAKILGSVLGGLAEWCDIEELEAAIDHFSENKESYKDMVQFVKLINQKADIDWRDPYE